MQTKLVEMPKYFTYPSTLREMRSVMMSFEDVIDRLSDRRAGRSVDELTMNFFTGTQLLLNGDIFFESGSIEKALNYFEKAARKFDDSLRWEDSVEVTPEVEYEVKRRTQYCNARVEHTKGRIAASQKAYSDAIAYLVNATKIYSSLIVIEREKDDFTHLIPSIAHMSMVFWILAKIKAIISNNPDEKRKNYYLALTNAKKARFAGAMIPDKELESLEQKIRDVTIKKYQQRLDEVYERGVELITNGNNSEAALEFRRGAILYEELQKIERRSDFALQEKIFRASAHEALAKLAIERDNNEKASEEFKKASSWIRKIISFLRELGNAALLQQFQLQSVYFEAMTTFVTGLLYYDKLNYQEANNAFNLCLDALQETIKQAEEFENPILIENCTNAIVQVEMYLETLSLMDE